MVAAKYNPDVCNTLRAKMKDGLIHSTKSSKVLNFRVQGSRVASRHLTLYKCSSIAFEIIIVESYDICGC
jgi:hypothetical protein